MVALGFQVTIGKVTTLGVVSSMLRLRMNWKFLRRHDSGHHELLVQVVAQELEHGEVTTLGILGSFQGVR